LLVLCNLKRFAMYSDPMPELTLETRDALSPLPPKHPPKEMTMERLYERLKCLSARAAVIAAALATSATLLLAVSAAYYSVSSEPVLADSPYAPHVGGPWRTDAASASRGLFPGDEVTSHRGRRFPTLIAVDIHSTARSAGTSRLRPGLDL